MQWGDLPPRLGDELVIEVLTLSTQVDATAYLWALCWLLQHPMEEME